MNTQESNWLGEGEGKRPRLSWSFSTEAPLALFELSRETGELIAADEAGTLYRLDRRGRLVNTARAPGPVRGLAWSDTGAGGVALAGEEKLCWFDGELAPEGAIEHAEPVLAVAIEHHGRFCAASLDDGTIALYDPDRKKLRALSAPQPFVMLQFLASRAALVGVAEYGLLACQGFDGEDQWQQRIWGHVADMSITGDDETILLACGIQGIQSHNSEGTQTGSYQIGGTAARVATSFLPGRIAAATQERQFFYLDSDGHIEFEAVLPESAARLLCDPFGGAVFVGFAGGRILRLDWPGPEE